MGNIVISAPMDSAQKQAVADLAQGRILYTYAQLQGHEEEILRDTEIILGNVGIQELALAPALKWMQLWSAGADMYTKPGILPEGTILTNGSGAYGHAIGEHMVGMAFALYKKLYLYRDSQNAGVWSDHGMVKSVGGTVVLSVGMGDIGGAFSQRMKALGATVIGVRRTVRAKPDYADEVYAFDALDVLLPRADLVALSLPNTPSTEGLLNAARMAAMKPGAFILNVGRGNAVDTAALCAALESGHLGGVGLDVTDPEPLPPGHPLWRIPNALITPHVSGGDHLRETYENVASICLENMRHYLAGETMCNLVDFETGYRALKTQ